MKLINVNEIKNKKAKVNMLLYGNPMAGKTSFALTFEKPVILSTDGNIGGLSKNAHAQAAIIKDVMTIDGKETYGWVAFKKYAVELLSMEEVETIVVDNIKDVYDMCRRYILDREGIGHENESKVRGKIWTQLEEEFFPVIRMLTTSEKSIVFIAHEKKNENEILPNTIDSVTIKLSRYVDFISRITITGLPGQEKVGLMLGQRTGTLNGNRYNIPGNLVNPTYQKLETIIKETLERG